MDKISFTGSTRAGRRI
ncbi:hypothetical protein, partial [Micromonospora arida]